MKTGIIRGIAITSVFFSLIFLVLWYCGFIFFRPDVESLLKSISLSEARLDGYVASRFVGEDLSGAVLDDSNHFVIEGVSLAFGDDDISGRAQCSISALKPFSDEYRNQIESYLAWWADTKLGGNISEIRVYPNPRIESQLEVDLIYTKDWTDFSYLSNFRRSHVARTDAEQVGAGQPVKRSELIDIPDQNP